MITTRQKRYVVIALGATPTALFCGIALLRIHERGMFGALGVLLSIFASGWLTGFAVQSFQTERALQNAARAIELCNDINAELKRCEDKQGQQ